VTNIRTLVFWEGEDNGKVVSLVPIAIRTRACPADRPRAAKASGAYAKASATACGGARFARVERSEVFDINTGCEKSYLGCTFKAL